MMHRLINAIVAGMYHLGRFFRFVRKRRPIDDARGIEVLLTGTFHSDAWIQSWAVPIAAAERCRNVVLVTTFPTEEQPGVELVYPPAVLRRVFGDVIARLLVFAWQAMRRQSELVGGFYIAPNALFAELVANMSGANSMYVCVGGVVEVQDGGVRGESRLFGKLTQADPGLERRLLRTVRDFDVVVPMGSSAVDWFRDNGVSAARIKRITIAVDASRFKSPAADRPVDIVYVGRLEPIKDLTILLHTARILADSGRKFRLRLVGRGSEEDKLKQLSSELGLDDCVEFAGFVPDVSGEVGRAKCFVLTSKSEGVSGAMIEAMLAGAVPVVANVGDLGDVIRNGENGFLVDSREPEEFAARFTELLADEQRLSAYSQAAYETGLNHDIGRVAIRWNELLGDIGR